MENRQASQTQYLSSSGVSLMPSMPAAGCGQPAVDRRLPGYDLNPFVTDFMPTPAGDVPRISTHLSFGDRLATARVRCGIQRYQYTVSPGLYALGSPDNQSEVLVTANFKLTFDQVRSALKGQDFWLLVLDTKGVNVWCAAGKGTFGTQELVKRISDSGLEKVVTHRRLILPQLGATGINAGQVRKLSGFRVVYGPVRAADIPRFMSQGRQVSPGMRDVTFGFLERLVLTPVEIQIALKPALITALVIFLLSGIGPGIFSFSGAWSRGWDGTFALVAGLLSGAVITPALLPLIPVREFALKGIFSGLLAGVLLLAFLARESLGVTGSLALILFTIAVSSFLAMNFTGTTPFTSPSGVEKEMKRYIPVQLACLVLSAGFWIYSGF